MESKELSWKWTDVDILLSHGPCELLYAKMVPSTAGTSTAKIYDGESTGGDIIFDFRTAESKAQELNPPKPIYCRRGLYVNLVAVCKGMFVQWRELGSKG